MDKKAVEEFEKENNVIYVSEIKYQGKKYIKALKSLKGGFDYMYYEIVHEKSKEVKENEIILGIKQNYENKPSNIIY